MSPFARRVFSTLAFGVSLLAAASVVQAQQASPAEADATAPPAEPTPAELATDARAVQDSAAVAAQQIERISALDGLRASLEAAEVRQRELVSTLVALRAIEHTRPERLFRLRDRALAQEARLEQISEEISERLDELSTLRAAWLGRLGTWTAWRDAAQERPEFAPQLPEVERAIEQVDSVLERSSEIAPEITALEEKTARIQAENRQLIERVAALRAGRREALRRADQPVLLSQEHLRSLRDPEQWNPATAAGPEALAAFVRDHALLLLVHLLLVLGIGLLARRLRPHAVPEGGWFGMLDHPWAVAVFAATAFLARRYILAPPVWDVVIWSLLAGSGAVLAATLLRGPMLRLMIISVAAVYPLVLLGEALHVPVSIFRLLLALAAAAAVIGFPILASRADITKPVGRRARWVLTVATALSASVLIAQILGFDQLSRWLVHAMLTSAYVAFSVVFLVVMARGALRTLLRKEFVGRARLVGTLAVPLAERLVTLLQVVLVLIGGLVLLDVWEVAPSPIETWNAVQDWGFTVVGLEITLGRVIFASILVYLALTASWLARTIVTSKIAVGWGFERGVAESINSLLHYTVITVGILLALGALGVQLQNFAIVAGALGVGIGFGLQNVVNNFVSGLILLFERPVRAGDTVEIGGEWGTIKKIGLRSTVVVTFSQSELIVPNGDLVSEKVTNWTLTNPVTRITVPVGVAYGSDVQKVLRILVECAQAHPAIVQDPEPLALFTGFGDSSLDFELRIWVREVQARFLARSAVLAEIDRRFREEGVEIPFPQRDLHLRSVDPHAAATILPPSASADGGAVDG